MLIKFKPNTPGQRGTVLVSKKHLSKEAPFKSLTKPMTSSGGRNNQGRITSRRKGGGVKRKYRESRIKKDKWFNIKLLPYQERKYMPVINLFADFHFIAMNKRMEHDGFPSKVYTIMSSGKPIVVVSSKETPIISFLEKTNAAITVTNHSIADFKKAVLKLEADKDLRYTLGTNGRKVVEQKFNKRVVIKKYIKLAEDI